MEAKKKGGGGKLSRSEIVTVRLDPKLRFAVELAARKQRRTASSFIEWAITEAIKRLPVRIHAMKKKINVPQGAYEIPEELPIGECLQYLQQLNLGEFNINKKTVHEIVKDVWHPDESHRFVLLAIKYPELLTHDEEVLWNLIDETSEVWRYPKEENIKIPIYAELKRRWEEFKRAASGASGKVSARGRQRGS
jgi:hypothetical protein